MTNEKIHELTLKSIKEMFTKNFKEHSIGGMLCTQSIDKLDEEDKDYYFLNSNDNWLLYVKVAEDVGLNLICESIGHNFYKVKDVWVRDRPSYWPARNELLQFVAQHTAGGLVYLLPPDERAIWEEVSDHQIREAFMRDLVALVDQMAKKSSQYNEK